MSFISRLDDYVQGYLDAYDRQQKRKAKYVRPTHNLMCDCRTCVPAMSTYARRVMG